MFVPFSAFGITLWRRLLTSAVVLLSAGPCMEIALKNALVPALSTWIGVTAATPAVAATSFWSVVRRGSVARGSLWELEDDPDDDEDEDDAGCAGEPSEIAMVSGPLLPGPKLSDIRS